MAITLGQIIDAARNRHPLFVKTAVPNVVFAAYLSDYQRTLLSKAIQRDTSFLTISASFPFDATALTSEESSTTGVVLPSVKRIVGGTVQFTSDPTRIERLTLVDYADRTTRLGSYVAWITSDKLYFSGSELDWTDVASIELRYVGEPADLAALTDTIVLPDSARPVFVARAALMAGSRVTALGDAPTVDMAGLAQDAAEAESAWLTEIQTYKRAKVHRIRERRSL